MPSPAIEALSHVQDGAARDIYVPSNRERPIDHETGTDASALGLYVISIVDDDESARAGMRSLLRSAGYRVLTFCSAELFLESGALGETECLILDIRMPGMDGLELQRALKMAKFAAPVIFVSAHDGTVDRRVAIDAGAAGFFQKPCESNALVRAIQAALMKEKG